LTNDYNIFQEILSNCKIYTYKPITNISIAKMVLPYLCEWKKCKICKAECWQ